MIWVFFFNDLLFTVNDLSHPGTYAGQDALVAFARLHGVNIIIHQLNRPLWKIQGSENCSASELHLSYHNGEHYSSVRRFGDIANAPAGIRMVLNHFLSSSICICSSFIMMNIFWDVADHNKKRALQLIKPTYLKPTQPQNIIFKRDTFLD